jgi:hypothetical protein
MIESLQQLVPQSGSSKWAGKSKVPAVNNAMIYQQGNAESKTTWAA